MTIQGTTEWHASRQGKITASRFNEVVNGGPARWMSLLADIREDAERPADELREQRGNIAMEWGTTHEATARMWYELETANDVEEVGFIDLPMRACVGRWPRGLAQFAAHQYVGGSPDGLVGTDGMIEIKCPYTSGGQYFPMHLYRAQVQGLLWITGRQWCDYVEYDPRLTLPGYTERIERDEGYITTLASRVLIFAHYLADNTNPVVEDFRTGPVPELF